MATMPDLIRLWDDTATATLAVARGLGDDDWSRPTALPGWTVRDLVAHLAHLESEAAVLPQPAGGTVEVSPSRRNGPMPTEVTHAGVTARRDASPAALLEEFAAACAARPDALADLDLSDPKATAPGLAGALDWDLRTWLTNRPIDLWMHAQDLRRAVGAGVETESAGAAHVAGVFARAFPIALRRLPPGTTVVLRVDGPQGRVLAARVGDDGRAAPVEPPEPGSRQASDGATEPDTEQSEAHSPVVTLATDDVTWLLLASGRLAPQHADVRVEPDSGPARETADRVLRQLNVVP
ncbi:maleylpyruvate isomerase family mycothiol-dependent enzyme [Piscicoccus intestinalis]|uniref:maleylpyruvate isomerase family mycothiol-dependent enzyme n=1 Tax=Piscicoccus intestinalis TaxID=746033 RepID=UPI0008385B6A|nr:maleylpyruvate isomerase family mycothiol-dependent enzyme [Piscicoccus intestinalis]